jgi:hypothetical protein
VREIGFPKISAAPEPGIDRSYRQPRTKVNTESGCRISLSSTETGVGPRGAPAGFNPGPPRPES